MADFTVFLIPGIIGSILLLGCLRKLPVFELFTQGAKEGLLNCASILPTLAGLLMGVAMLKASGAFELLGDLLSPVLEPLGISSELVPLAFMKPVSGSGSTALLQNVFDANGPDSFAGSVASVLCASSETTLYCISVYFGSIQIKNSRHALPAALLADAAACIFSLLFVHIFFHL